MNTPIKRHKVTEWIRKHELHISCLQETHLTTKDINRLKVKGWRKIFQANGHEIKDGVVILISDKITFKTKAIKRYTGHFIILKERIHQEGINIASIYAPNVGSSKYLRKILEGFKKDIDSNTLTIGDFSITLSTMDRSSKENINSTLWQ